jgi:hypothetical protein
MTRACALALAVVCLLAGAPAAAAAGPPVEVSISRTQVSTRLGESFNFSSTVKNTAATPQAGMVASLNIVGLSAGIYVDPEDWSEERTRFLPTLAPGESTRLDWKVKAVTGGQAKIYVVALPRTQEPAVSQAIAVRIADTKDFNSGGVLPLALGVPALLGLVTLGVRRRRRSPEKG